MAAVTTRSRTTLYGGAHSPPSSSSYCLPSEGRQPGSVQPQAPLRWSFRRSLSAVDQVGGEGGLAYPPPTSQPFSEAGLSVALPSLLRAQAEDYELPTGSASPQPSASSSFPRFLKSSLSAAALEPCGRLLCSSGADINEAALAGGGGSKTKTAVHHRRCISLQDGRDQLQRNVEAQRVHVGGAEAGKEGSGITVALLGKDATKEEMEGYVVRLESEIRQLEAKLDDFKCHSQGWVGLEEKRNRKKLVDEMSRTLASKRKQLHACHKRLRAVDKQHQAALSAASSKSPSSDDDDGEDGGVSPPNAIKELSDAAFSKPQETFLNGLLRRLRERQLNLNKYYYYEQDCEGNSNSNSNSVIAKSEAAASPLLAASGSPPVFSAGFLSEPPRAYSAQREQLEVSYDDIAFREGVLGHGCFGAVYPASLSHAGPVAVKILKCGPRQRQSYQREIGALKRALECPVLHPQLPPPIVRLRGYCAEPHACIITELCEGGSIESVIRAKGKLSDKSVARVGMRVAEAMLSLLALDPPIFHRDLSTANILLRKPNDFVSACLADFGIAVEVTCAELQTYPEGAVSTSKNGNPRYRAPEVTLSGRYNKKSDVFSFGLVLFEMLTGMIPFAEVETKRVAQHIADGHRPKFPKGTTTDKRLRRLVKRCCMRNPDRRPDFTVIAHKLAKVDAAAQD